MKRLYAIVAGLSLTAGVALAADLLDARSILRAIDNTPATEKKANSKPAQLLSRINIYRDQAKTLPADVAATEWFVLLDQAQELGTVEWAGDYESFDAVTQRVVSVRSVLAALPPPAAWSELRRRAEIRAKESPQSVAVLAQRMMTEALNNDAAAVQSTLGQLDVAAAALAPDERLATLQLVAMARSAVAKIYGTPNDIAASFLTELELAKRGALGEIQIPDLVGLVGAERAADLLRQAVSSPARLEVSAGDDTRALARRVAMENAASLRVAQWGLVDSIDADALYEVLQQRFGNQGAGDDEESIGGEGAFADYDYYRNEADIYYLLSKIVAGQQAKAESALLTLAGARKLYLPKEAVNALQRANQSEALVTFLHAMLGKRPELQAWDVYIDQASYVGRSEQALLLIGELLERKNLNPSLRALLQQQKAQALLAANRVDAGIAEMRRQLSGKPKASDKSLPQVTGVAIRLANIGQLLKRPELMTEGLAYAEAAVALDGDALGYERAELLHGIWAAHRRAGKPALAQALAVRELGRAGGSDENLAQFGIPMSSPGKRAALVELIGLYGGEQRHTDVLALLDESKQWGARDLAEFIAEKDSMKTPVGMVAARALAASGKRDAALNVVRALLDRLPGYDPAYELFIELTGDRAVAELDALYARDEFEERPLIWKAHTLAKNNQLADAETVIRQAIAIDPSDGEQGKNDRLRAYAVLADIMAAKRETQQAATYRKAIDAIRISESADDFYAAGLYDRAFAMYRDALSRFSDAYCIQSRLAIQLTQRGQHADALTHYRRAYELMPESFGRVESHCFGCESVFKDSAAQGIAETVFQQAIEHDRRKPQAHYLLGYLRQEQGRLNEALELFRATVALDDQYLSAWKHLHELGDRTYIAADERDIARFKLLRLDPRQRHVRYDLTKVRDIAELWNQVERVAKIQKPAATAYRLQASAAMYDAALEKLPPEIRMQMTRYMALMESTRDAAHFTSPHASLLKHSMVEQTAALLGEASESW